MDAMTTRFGSPTVAGLAAVLVWGTALPVVRLCEEHVGAVIVALALFVGGGLIGFMSNATRGVRLDRAAFRHPLLYVRWGSFVLHEVCIIAAVTLVSKAGLPLVVFLNYLWPTAVIFCSIAMAGVHVMHRQKFALGIFVVISSLALEVLKPSSAAVGQADIIAYMLAVIGALAWGIYSAVSSRAGDATGGSSPIPLFQVTVGLILATVFSLTESLVAQAGASIASEQVNGCAYAILAAYCVAETIAYFGWDYGMRRGNVVLLSLSADFIPWLSLLGTWLLVGADISHNTMVAAVALVVGAMMVRAGTAAPKISPPAPDAEVCSEVG